MSDTKGIFFNFLVFSITLIFGLGISETVLRVKNVNQRNYNIEMWRYSKLLKKKSLNPDLGHEHVPGSRAKLQGVEVRLNGLGMRGPDLDLSDHKSKRILFLGSSNTLGWGVRQEDILTSLLQKELLDQAQVMNAGIGNYNAVRYITLYDKRLRYLKPDIVVVHYFVNDAEMLKSGGGNFILRHSQLAVTLYHAFRMIFNASRSMEDLISHYRSVYAENSAGLKKMHAAMQRLNELSREDGFKVVLAMTPDIHMKSPYPFTFIHDHMREVAGRYGWVYIDLTQALSTVDWKELWTMPGDPHINARGHHIMANVLKGFLK